MSRKMIKYYIIKSLRIKLDTPEQTYKEVKKIIDHTEEKFHIYVRYRDYIIPFVSQKEKVEWMLSIIEESIKKMSAEDTGARYFFICDDLYRYGLKSSGLTIKNIVMLSRLIINDPTQSPESKLPVLTNDNEENIFYSLSILLKQVITRDFVASIDFIRKV